MVMPFLFSIGQVNPMVMWMLSIGCQTQVFMRNICKTELVNAMDFPGLQLDCIK